MAQKLIFVPVELYDLLRKEQIKMVKSRPDKRPPGLGKIAAGMILKK